MSETAQVWYILQTEAGHCSIVSTDQLPPPDAAAQQRQWGPFTSKSEALARRVGLIRSGKCKPV
jgi:hypothetical protein